MDITESDKKKAHAFVKHLMMNPALNNFSALQKEEQICQFLMVNANQLYPTLASPSFFKGRNWEQISRILLSVIYDETNKLIIPDIQQLINDLDLTFFSFLDAGEFDDNAAKQTIAELIVKMLKNEQARRIFTGSFTAVKTDFVKKYITACYMRRKYIHFEITKVERLRFGEREAENMLTLVILLRPLIYMMATNNVSGRSTANGFIFQNNFTEHVAKNLSGKAEIIPPQVFKSAMNANASFVENNRLEATARLANVISSMCRNYKPEAKKDRGADTAMKSWISVARKNYKFYGYDIKLLDELYNIAADNGW